LRDGRSFAVNFRAEVAECQEGEADDAGQAEPEFFVGTPFIHSFKFKVVANVPKLVEAGEKGFDVGQRVSNSLWLINTILRNAYV
jgi:hypothetical protein